MAYVEEHWVEVEDFPNYIVSNYGRVFNVKTNVERKQCKSNDFYYVALYDNGLREVWYIHRLVAKAFFLNYDEYLQVKHINGDKNDNSVLNLTLTSEKKHSQRKG